MRTAGPHPIPRSPAGASSSSQVDIAEEQELLGVAAKRGLREVEAPEAEVMLWLSEDGRIVLPARDSQVTMRICAVAHQGRHGHVPAGMATERVRKYFV